MSSASKCSGRARKTCCSNRFSRRGAFALHPVCRWFAALKSKQGEVIRAGDRCSRASQVKWSISILVCHLQYLLDGLDHRIGMVELDVMVGTGDHNIAAPCRAGCKLIVSTLPKLAHR